MPRLHIDSEPMIKILLRTLLEEKLGKSFDRCELCKNPIPNGRAEMHHTKYIGATIYDLQVVCHKCNMQPENKNLA